MKRVDRTEKRRKKQGKGNEREEKIDGETRRRIKSKIDRRQKIGI